MSSALRPETGLDLPPDRPPRVGIIGGGQLARMMAQAAVSLGVEVHVLAGSSDEGVPGVFASVTTGDPEDVAAIDAFADTVDVVTFDHENVSWEALDALVARGVIVHPGPETMRSADKALQREHLARAGEEAAAQRDAAEWVATLTDTPYGDFGRPEAERVAIHREMVQKLIAEGKAYCCTCPPDELERKRKKALAEGSTIVFVDESGLSQRPHRVRTWSPRGQTPVLQYAFNWKSFSVIAGITVLNFYFRLHDGAVKSPQVVEFLGLLLRHIRGKLLVVWDGAAIHRSREVAAFIEGNSRRLDVHRLPAYAPELNPAEYIWGHLKNHELANFCAKHGWELSMRATAALRRMRRRPRLVEAFWKQAELW